MSIKALFTSLLTICLLTSVSWAQQSSAGRIDVNVNSGKLEFKKPTDKNANVYYANWVKEEDKKVMRVCSELKVTDEQWSQMTLEVTPTEDGPLGIEVKSKWDKENRNWVYVDDITVEGALKPITNGSFEETGGWSMSKSQQVLDESLAHTGKGAALVWHDKATRQTVQVKAGGPVKITAWFKFCKQEPKS